VLRSLLACVCVCVCVCVNDELGRIQAGAVVSYSKALSQNMLKQNVDNS
jgi:hypothetical protein